MGMVEKIEERLRSELSPTALSVVDDSEAHLGHAGYQEGGESHFILTISADSLEGKTRVAQHRAIYSAIGKDIMSRIHALGITVN